MISKDVYIAGVGILSPLGIGLADTEQALRQNRSGIAPLSVFSVQHPPPMPVAQVRELPSSSLPRTHILAVSAARQAMAGFAALVPDGVILGTTTGGILTTEDLLAAGEQDPKHYSHHGLSTVAETVADQVGCTGKALTVSTACSSGAVAISLALKMLQSGQAEWILAGGADSLCHLTYFGFHSLQLVDPEGSRPFDKNRQGMSVGEGAAMLLLTTQKPDKPLGKLLGAGLSCDAYHAAAPHPEGKGACKAMRRALANAGLPAEHVSYISLHGTGTPDNDLAESKAVRELFPTPPPLSSIKGATGHGLAAAGAIEAVIATLCCTKNFLPANTGYQEADPELQLQPIHQPQEQAVSTVLSNSFGFGGNNGCLVIGEANSSSPSPGRPLQNEPLTILGTSCITGAGNRDETMARLFHGESVMGMLPLEAIAQDLPARKMRRLKRFSRLTLALAHAAHKNSGLEQTPNDVFMGTGWGALSETNDFLTKLRETKEQFPSPIDFVGSVHNSAAGQVAIMFDATGANITSSGGDYSFEQSFLTADTMLDDDSDPAFILSADEGHTQLSHLFDPSIFPEAILSDGGGGFSLSRKTIPGKVQVRLPFFQMNTPSTIDALVDTLARQDVADEQYGLILAGIPAAVKKDGEQQLQTLLNSLDQQVPVLRYRELTGEFASASAVAAVIAVHCLETNQLPPGLAPPESTDSSLAGKKILLLGLGDSITAMEFRLP